jgi:hypothetical protein
MLRRKLVCTLFSTLASGLLLGALATPTVHAQQPSPDNDNGKKLPSPPQQASEMLEGKLITIDYSAPSMRGRKIMGELVPYDKVWRTGANAATTLTTPVNLKIGDLSVPAGTYTIYSLPTEATWKLIVNKQTKQWGTVYNQDQDFGRTDMKREKAPAAPVEQFAIKFEDTHGKKTQLHLIWDTADVYVPVTAE